MVEFVGYIYTISEYLQLDNPARVMLLILDISIVTLIIMYMYKIIKKTRAEQIAKGIFYIIALITISKILNLTILNFIFDNFITYGIFILIVVFQPELRSAFEKIGTASKIKTIFDIENDIEAKQTISELVKAFEIMSLKKIGAIIVLQRKTYVGDILKDGINIYSRVSSELIQNIFTPRTPLHDGAVIIENNQILAAKCILPLASENMVEKGLGTRHRAAVGISEISDCIVIVVSEETGTISIAENGKLKRDFNVDSLKSYLIKRLVSNEGRPKPFKMEKNKYIKDTTKERNNKIKKRIK